MKLFTILCLLGSVLVSAVQAAGHCNADNCARAVTGTRLGSSQVASASRDCVSYFAAANTVTIPGQAVSITSIVLTTLTIAKRDINTALATKLLPVYASECKDAAQYYSACSCGFGATSDTQIVTTANVTVTVYQTSTITSHTASPTCTANILTDPLNCGKCGHICNSGTCQNGACGSTQCPSNQNCDNGFKTCGASTCFCFADSTGTGFCGQNAVCAAATACASDKDCGNGSICAKDTCCLAPSPELPGICLVGECFNPADKLRSLSRMRRSDLSGGTAARRAE
ncbi:hypothetical protein BJ878DRAFT_148573 [Calycina marina]|uniref:Antifreeze protein n=1 Tax=Calycina marina TaxID=1763456 RepID=A0A9P8CDK7_9HELO|nr:hypothetical protein BJ878DRAFT_148573 [Calycina marina]